VKPSVEISDALLERARQHGLRTGQTLRALIEEGIRLALRTEPQGEPYRLPDRSVGEPGDPNPLESLSLQDLRSVIYGEG
jgi:hypothetical protein